MPERTRAPQQSFSKNLGKELGRYHIFVPDYQEVISYLEANPQLGEILPSIYAQARSVFGSESEMITTVRQDPEFDDCYLCLTIRLPSYDDNVTQLLDQVTEPFEAELCSASGYVLVTTDFRNPQQKSILDWVKTEAACTKAPYTTEFPDRQEENGI
jgi:hypothetical protein